MKKCSQITDISLEDFLKLNLVAYAHRKHYYNKDNKEISYEQTGEWINDSQGSKHWVSFEGIYSKLVWDKVNLNEEVLDNIEFSNEEGFKNRCICVAIHTEPTEKEVRELKDLYNKNRPEDHQVSYEEAYEYLLFEYSYLDKWLTRCGHQTYLLCCDVEHLYSEKRKFATHDDYFEVPKSETKAVYLIRY